MRFGEACQAVTGSAVTANVNMATHAIDAINDEIKELEEVWQIFANGFVLFS